MTCGAKIASQRNRLAMTQGDLAEKISVPLRDITNWESNITEPNKEMSQRLADLFEIDPKDIYGDDDGEPIFKDHPEDGKKPINKKICRRYSLIFAVIGVLLSLSFVFFGFFVLTPALISLGASGFFFHKSTPLMPFYMKFGIFLMAGIVLVMLVQGFAIFMVSIFMSSAG